MKTCSLLLAGALALSALVPLAHAAVTVRIENKDSKEYVLKARCGGESGKDYEISVRAEATASYTWQGPKPCVVSLGGQTRSFSGGESFTISGGQLQ